MQTDDIIQAVGSLHLFQFVMMSYVFGSQVLMAWAMLMMSFAGTAPDWWCVPEQNPSVNETLDSYMNNVTSSYCPPSGNTTCQFVYRQDRNTITNEWDLVCERSVFRPLVTSIQMGGVLIGAFFGGQSADLLGRKWTFFISLALHAGFNLVAAFSTSWQMFAAMRFLIGSMIGSLLVVHYPYFVEFLGTKWRPISSAFPVWVTGVCIFAMSCWLRPDWSHQHIIVAALHVPFFTGWFIIPESLRFLAVKGRLEEAERVVDQMSRYNKRPKPSNTSQLLKEVADEEERQRASGKKYTYLDIYRDWSICRKSLIVQFLWMCLSLVYYGISFGVGKLSGNLYLNIFLLSVVEIPTGLSTFFLNNRLGRRRSAFSFFVGALICSFGVAITTRTASVEEQAVIINVLAMGTKLAVGAAWCCVQLLSSEIYPTVTRNLGYGACNTTARIGGIIAPFIFAIEGDDVLVPFVIVGSTMTVCALCTLFLPETKGLPLHDTIGNNDPRGHAPMVTLSEKEKTMDQM